MSYTGEPTDLERWQAWRDSPGFSVWATMPDDFQIPSTGFETSDAPKPPAPAPAPIRETQVTSPTGEVIQPTQPQQTTQPVSTTTTNPLDIIGNTQMPQTNVLGGSLPSTPEELINLPRVDTAVTGLYPEQSEMVQTQVQEMGTSEVGQQVTGTEQLTAEQSFLDRMDPATRAAYEELLTQQLAGGSTLQQAQQTALTETMSRLGVDTEQYSMENAIQFAQGGVDELTQNLLEQIIPQIQQGASGTGSVENALAQIMSQNAAVKTGTAQQQAILEAIMGFGQLSQQGAQVTGQLATAGDPIVNTIMQLIETGKGATEATVAETEIGTREEQLSTTNTLQQLLNQLEQQTAATSTQGLFQYPVVNQ